MNANNARAVAEIFIHRNPHYDATTGEGLAQCDLHFLHVSEAVQVTREHIMVCKQFGYSKTVLVTGYGNHSRDGVARLKPALAELLNEGGLGVWAQVGHPNPGCMTVHLGR